MLPDGFEESYPFRWGSAVGPGDPSGFRQPVGRTHVDAHLHPRSNVDLNVDDHIDVDIDDDRPVVVPTSPAQWFAPSGRNGGTEGLATFLANLAIRDNAPLYNSEPARRTTGSNLSDHHVSRSDSWAADVAVRGIQAPTAQTETAARRIASALGQPNWTGGDLTTTIDGYRFQVLWKVAGHFNHVHVGVRKI